MMQPQFSKAIKSQTMREKTGLCDVRAIESASALELYITATPVDANPVAQAKAMYAEMAHVLRQHKAIIVEERLFASPDAIEPALAARRAEFGELDDGIVPTLLTPRTLKPQIVGAQIHAIRGIPQPTLMQLGDEAVARTFSLEGYNWITGTALRDPKGATADAQSRTVFEKIEGLLKQRQSSMIDVARTWVWMDNILDWYGPFNKVRNQFFTERGLMCADGRMPASTGIGVSPYGNVRCAIDFFAAWGKPNTVRRFHAAGKQRSAYEYGSAFARAATTKTPAGLTMFCSGTAAIDTEGNTCHDGDIRKQVAMTVENVNAVLRDLNCSGNDVVQALAYCVSPAVEDAFIADFCTELPWPCLTMIGDVCRGDLLFEVEVTACPGAHRI